MEYFILLFLSMWESQQRWNCENVVCRLVTTTYERYLQTSLLHMSSIHNPQTTESFLRWRRNRSPHSFPGLNSPVGPYVAKSTRVSLDCKSYVMSNLFFWIPPKHQQQTTSSPHFSFQVELRLIFELWTRKKNSLLNWKTVTKLSGS